MKKKWISMLTLLFLIILGLLPILFLIVQSLASNYTFPEILPSRFTLQGWKVVMTENRMGQALSNTLIIGGAAVLLNLLLGLPAGKALAFYYFKGKGIIEAIIFLPLLIPMLALAMGLQIVMLKLGLCNSILGVILIHLLPTLPYSIRIYRGGYENIGIKWEEQAKTLGANNLTVFKTIYLPLLLPSIRSGCVLAFVISLSQYVLTALIGGGNVLTLALIYYPYFDSLNKTILAAFSLVFAVLPILFLIVIEIMMAFFIPHHLASIKRWFV
jgi:putative spermidine/putrescine transport system permease protein